MQEWLQAANEREAVGEPYVLVTVLRSFGSAPRDAGAKMLVSTNGAYGTIGGGNLEFQAIKKAQEMLSGLTEQPPLIESYDLAVNLGQCCGGKVEIFFEPFFTPQKQILLLFGAGHLGKALVSVLSGLPCQIHWYDGRSELFPRELPSNVQAFELSAAETDASDFPPGASFVIMTHNHQDDFLLCENILRFGEFNFLGMIGSRNKRARFDKLMLSQGLSADLLQRLECPMGIPDISSKKPQAIAISVAARLLQLWNSI
jgi:xanthine dehydrogenase accessory factor